MDGIRRTIETLHPAYFDIVMATGIVAVAAHFERIWLVPLLLAYLNIALCAGLGFMNAIRLIRYRAEFMRDLADFDRGPGFFTMVAGIAVLGSQTAIILDNPRTARALWIVSLALWICLNYTIFVRVTISEDKPRLQEGINGGWLLSVVATQSVAGLAAQLAENFEHTTILFLALLMWLAGGMLCVWLIAPIFYRFIFLRFKPEDFMPPFWINMGAMAISALTGTALIARAPEEGFLIELLPFLKGLTLLFWATATWWIPMLASMAVWQHLIRRFNRPYSLLHWGVVFPLGMYTVATYELSHTVYFPFLQWIPRVFVYIALLSWVATFTSMLHGIARPGEVFAGRNRNDPTETRI